MAPSGPALEALEFRRHSYDDAVVQELVGEMAVDLAALYGPAEFPAQDAADWSGPHGAMFVGWCGGLPVACGGLVRHDDRAAEVKRMFVRPVFRRMGVARRLLHALSEEGARLGYERLVLETGTLQEAAHRLYRAEGFAPIPCWPPHDADPTSICFARDVPR